MTDDFQLFPDPSGDPMDADIALITAYLARELSPVQIVAVEDRLAKDTEFRNKVRPIIDAWVMPSRIGAPVVVGGSLSRDEIEAGWQRYVGGRAELDAHDGPRLVVDAGQPKRRRISMTRITAGIAAVTLPIVVLAQVAVYVAKRPDAPGHSVVRDIVAPFTSPTPAEPAPQKIPEKPTPAAVDVPVGRQLEKPTAEVQRSAQAKVPAAELVFTNSEPPKPDRAKISALVSKYHENVVRNDTNASYVVMVLNARGEYVWSTYGLGSAIVEITGDTRTLTERLQFIRLHATEYTGHVPDFRGGGGGGGARGGLVPRTSIDTVANVGAVRARPIDTVAILGRSRDSTYAVARPVGVGARGGGVGGRLGRDTARSGMSGVIIPDSAMVGTAARATRTSAIAIGDMVPVDSMGTQYRLAFGWVQYGEYINVNEAPGLQQPGKGESGVQGLKSASVSLGESYQFVSGQLNQRGLRVFVLHLAPGANWKGR